MSDLTYISIAPYFILMACFAGIARCFDFENPKTEVLTPHGDRFNVPLESLRGVLALGVFFHHAVTTLFFYKTGKWGPAPSPFYLLLGSGPVIMFFFLSGYLFWGKCLNQGAVKKVGSFFLARARRLLPAYLFVLFFIVLMALIVTSFTLQESVLRVASEVVQWAIIGLPFGDFPDINHYSQTHLINAGVAWSLRYEVLFYFSIPLMGLFSRRHWTLVWVCFFSSLYGLMFKWAHSSSFVGGEWSEFFYNLSVFYGLGFSLGMLTAYLKELPAKWLEVFRAPAWGVIILGLIALQFYKNYPAYSVRQSSYLIIPFFLIACGNDVFTLLSRRPFLFLGKISYSIYLVHGVVIFTFSRLLNQWTSFENLSALSFWAFALISGCAAIAISTAIYRWIELPWLKRD